MPTHIFIFVFINKYFYMRYYDYVGKKFYPAVFSYEPDQEIAVVFPDLGCATSGENDDNALLSARELLGCVLCGLEEDGEDQPLREPNGYSSRMAERRCFRT